MSSKWFIHLLDENQLVGIYAQISIGGNHVLKLPLQHICIDHTENTFGTFRYVIDLSIDCFYSRKTFQILLSTRLSVDAK